ncbi:MAG: amino acid ABC transporter permease [Flexilinea sp.]
MTLSFNINYFFLVTFKLVALVPTTLQLTFLSLSWGSFFALLLTVGKLSHRPIIRKICFGYSTVIRCSPTIVLLFLIFYGLPLFFSPMGININNLSVNTFVVITFVMYTASYLSELFRSSFEAVEKGQFEAAASVGLTYFQTVYRIAIPQAFLISLPNLGNTIISTLKEMSLAFTIGSLDLLGKAKVIISNEYGVHTLETYMAVALLYWLISFVIERISAVLEKRFGKHILKLRT